MKKTVLSLISIVLFYPHAYSMENAFNERTGNSATSEPVSVLLASIKQAAKHPVVLRPSNKNVLEALKVIDQAPELKLFTKNTLPLCLQALLAPDAKSDESMIKPIDSIMTTLLFEDNTGGSDELATAKIAPSYMHYFPLLLNTLCQATPDHLLQKHQFRIVSTMPSLYETLHALQLVTSSDPRALDTKELEASPAAEYINQYVGLMVKSAQSNNLSKELLIARLAQKLGENMPFLKYVFLKVQQAPAFKKIDVLEQKYQNLTPIQAYDKIKVEGKPE